jgi:ATP-dependent RNA helicase DDX51/DBP6
VCVCVCVWHRGRRVDDLLTTPPPLPLPPFPPAPVTPSRPPPVCTRGPLATNPACPACLVGYTREGAAGFRVHEVEYVVVDEADRLLSQLYHNWIDALFHPTPTPTPTPTPAPRHHHPTARTPSSSASSDTGGATGGATRRPFASSNLAPFVVGQASLEQPLPLPLSPPPHPQAATASGEGGVRRVRKLLFSATLTRNPSKLAALHLQQPLYVSFSATQRYQTPKNLKEFMVRVRPEGGEEG